MGAPGAGAPPMFSDGYIAIGSILYTLPLPRYMEPPLPNHLPTPLHSACMHVVTLSYNNYIKETLVDYINFV